MGAMTDQSTTAAAARHRWHLQGVSVQGYSHLRDGVECQDAYRHTAVDAAGAHVLAVADGAGSRKRSAEGAALAVGLANSVLVERLGVAGVPDRADTWRSLLATAYDEIVSDFLAATERMGPDRGAFATTLTAVVLAPPWMGVVSIGDGIVIARVADHDGADQFHLVTFPPPVGEYVNEAVFLTSAGARQQVTVDCLHDPGLIAVVLGTDGLIPVAVRQKGGRRRPNRSFLEPVIDTLDDPADIARLLLEDRISALSADDKTLLMAVAP